MYRILMCDCHFTLLSFLPGEVNFKSSFLFYNCDFLSAEHQVFALFYKKCLLTIWLLFWGTILLRGNVIFWVWKEKSFAGIADNFVMDLNFLLERFALSQKRYLLNSNFRKLIIFWWEGSIPAWLFSIKKKLTQFKQVLISTNGTIFLGKETM